MFEVILSIVTLLAVIIGICWNIYQWRRKDTDRTTERAAYEANLTRDIGELKNHVTNIDNILGNGAGLKHDVQDLTKELQLTAKDLKLEFAVVTTKICGRIDVVETRLNEHIEKDKGS